MIPFDVVGSAVDTAKKSAIPVSVAIFLAYAIAWAVHVDGAVANSAATIASQDVKIDRSSATLSSIDRRLSRMEGALGIIEDERPHHEHHNSDSD